MPELSGAKIINQEIWTKAIIEKRSWCSIGISPLRHTQVYVFVANSRKTEDLTADRVVGTGSAFDGPLSFVDPEPHPWRARWKLCPNDSWPPWAILVSQLSSSSPSINILVVARSHSYKAKFPIGVLKVPLGNVTLIVRLFCTNKGNNGHVLLRSRQITLMFSIFGNYRPGWKIA